MTRTAVVAGAGGSLGAEICRALRQRGWRVVGVGRDAARLEAELGNAVDDIVAAELASPEETQTVMRRVGDVDALVYNAGKLDLAPLLETTPEIFRASWQANAFGAFVCARTLAEGMIQRARGSMILIGATASTRGGKRTHAFASAKHALRGLAASLAKELGPRGVHVAHVVIDGKVWGARTRARFPDVREDQCLEPTAVAATILGLIEQPPSAWTFEMDLRPAAEPWS
jgi:NAD(P)-dependent dehydrogenase (short-subunit alcohol dehydrogenase family)